jgi:hypothetical protein
MMRRQKPGPLLVAGLTVAGLVVGAGIALAAHKTPIPLMTYEELPAQFGMPQGAQMQVQVDPQSKKGFPYSPKQTCGGPNGSCHNYTEISDHAFHAAQGRNEFQDQQKNADGTFPAYGQFANKPKPWTQSTAMVGKW